MIGCTVSTLVAMVLATLALVYRPETRWPGLAAWIVLAIGLHKMAGEHVSLGSVVFAVAFTLPLALTGLAGYEVHQRWTIPMSVCVGVGGAVFLLFLVVFFRLLIASGSADYPYDD